VRNIVVLPEKTSFDLDKINKILLELGKKKGCEACCSGDPVELVIEEKLFDELKSNKDEKIYRYDVKTDSLIGV
jgi:hypothetical protein